MRDLSHTLVLNNSRLALRPRSRASDQGQFLEMVWIAFVLLSPFYFFDSGLPQIADYLVVLMLVGLAVTKHYCLPRAAAPVITGLAFLVAYVVAVNAVWAVHLGDATPLRYSSYYLFNLLGSCAVLAIYQVRGE
ncbi:MAG: hypothetical protein GTO41_09435, partial [Burkholderiales bacterium]|nr:hypothetical protein [Burkholderiales bacterium]